MATEKDTDTSQDVQFDEKKFEALINDTNKGLEKITKALDKKVETEQLKELQDELIQVKDNVNALSIVKNDEDKDIKTIDYIKNLEANYKSLEKEIADLRTKKGEEPKTLKSMIKETVNDDFVKALKERRVVDFTLDKAAADLLTSDWTADTGTVGLPQYQVPDISRAPWRNTPVYAAVTKRTVGIEHELRYTEELTRTDSAATAAEAASVAQSGETWISRRLAFYKVGHYAKFSLESLEDPNYTDTIRDEVNDLLTNGLLRALEVKLLTGSGSSDITGLTTIAQTFAKPNGFDAVDSANLWDLLRAGKLYVRKGVNAVTGAQNDSNKTGYPANYALISTSQVANFDVQKMTTGGYLMPPFWDVAAGRVAGMQILETDDFADDSKWMVGYFPGAVLYIKRNIVLTTSDNVASDFLADMTTIKATLRCNLLVKSFEKYGFVYGDIDTDIPLIEA